MYFIDKILEIEFAKSLMNNKVAISTCEVIREKDKSSVLNIYSNLAETETECRCTLLYNDNKTNTYLFKYDNDEFIPIECVRSELVECIRSPILDNNIYEQYKYDSNNIISQIIDRSTGNVKEDIYRRDGDFNTNSAYGHYNEDTNIILSANYINISNILRKFEDILIYDKNKLKFHHKKMENKLISTLEFEYNNELIDKIIETNHQTQETTKYYFYYKSK